MATPPPGSASAQQSDVMSGLEVRSPIQPSKSAADLVDQVRARTQDGQPDPAAKPDALAAKAPPPNPNAFAEIEARKPPGPQAKPAPAPLKGPDAATPPKGPSAANAAAAAKAASAKIAAAKIAAAKAAAAGGQVPGGQAPGGQAPGGQAPGGQAPGGQASGKSAAPPEAAMPPAAAAMPAGPPTATSMIDDTASWLPDEPDRRAAFLQVFRYWHGQVRPEYAHKARPAFLFLVTALPVMVKARDDLKALNLWEPPGDQSRQARDVHPAWKKYCEFLPRAAQALQELDDYRHLSLLSALDDLNGRVSKAEKRFREGPARR
jgi:hypothetical protein